MKLFHQSYFGALLTAAWRHPLKAIKRRTFVMLHSPGAWRLQTNVSAILRYPFSAERRRAFRRKFQHGTPTEGGSPLLRLKQFIEGVAPRANPKSFALKDILKEICGDNSKRILAYYSRYGLPSDGRSAGTKIPTQREIAAWAIEMDILAARRPKSPPEVSIIVPVHNHLHHTIACIHSLLDLETKIPFEIIIADDASTDDTQNAFRQKIDNVVYLRSASNLGFIGICNFAASKAVGEFVLFLNNDTIVLPGWLDELVNTIRNEDNVGLVGSMFLSGNGLVQESGGIVWRDGSAWNYGRGLHPLSPDISYMRDVDYVSGASIMLRRALWEEMCGFDAYYDFAYCEDTDLALRISAKGQRVVVQPMSMLLHFEGVSSGTDETKGAKAYQVNNLKKLFQRWESRLASHRPNAEEPLFERERTLTKRLLVIDAVTPSPDEDAGSVACFALMRAFQKSGFKVTFMPQSNLQYMPKQTRALQRIGIEAVYYPFFGGQLQYLAERGSHFDAILVFRGGVAFEMMEAIYHYAPQAKIIFHVADLHFLRETRQAALSGNSASGAKSIQRTKAREMYAMYGSDLTIVHSLYEAELLATVAPDLKVYVFPWIFNPQPTATPFAERTGVGFIAGYNHQPNVDAVHYFVEEVWPKVLAVRKDIVFRVYGSHVPPSISMLHGKDNIEVVGYVEDLEDCFGRLRISVAPLRFGAGLKGKVATSMAYGVPVVGTQTAAEGMALADGENVIVRDDPQDLADAIMRLYDDGALWNNLSSAGLKFVDDNYSERRGVERIGEVLSMIALDPSPLKTKQKKRSVKSPRRPLQSTM